MRSGAGSMGIWKNKYFTKVFSVNTSFMKYIHKLTSPFQITHKESFYKYFSVLEIEGTPTKNSFSPPSNSFWKPKTTFGYILQSFVSRDYLRNTFTTRFHM